MPTHPDAAPPRRRRWVALPLVIVAGLVLTVTGLTLYVLSDPTTDCGSPLPIPEWEDLERAPTAPAATDVGDVTAVTEVVHRADNGQGSASVAVAVRHWGPNPPPSPSQPVVNDDAAVSPCAIPPAREAGTVEYLAHAGGDPVALAGERDEETLERLFGAPTELEVDEESVTTAAAELPREAAVDGKAALAVLAVGAVLTVAVAIDRRRARADGPGE